MTTRRFFFGLLFALVILACFAGWLWIASVPRVTLAKFERVNKGMSREEVIRTVGSQPAKIADVPGQLYIEPDASLDIWACEEGMLLIHFDDNGIAARVAVERTQPPTLIEKIRHWLGL
jgi:hypothetical protein